MTTRPAKYVSAKGVTSWHIQWRYGGTADGARQTATVGNLDDAKRLKSAVEGRLHYVYAKDPEVRSGAIYGVGQPDLSGPRDAPLWPAVAAEYRAQVSGQRKSTRDIADRNLRLHLSRWNNLTVGEISRADVVTLMRDYEMVRFGRGYGIFVLAHAVLGFAVEQGYIAKDPSEGIKFETEAQPQHMFWSTVEVDVIMTAAETVDPYIGQMLALMLSTGLRNGELCGLQRRDFSGLATSDPLLTISRSVSRRAGRTVIGPTKSGKPRTIVLGASTAAAMRTRLRAMPRSDEAWVWPKGDDVAPGGHAQQSSDEPISTERLRDRFARILDEAVELGLDPSRRGRVQDLRHSHSSHLLVDGGVSMLMVSQRLGHASISTTQKHYASISQGSIDALRAALG